ncbi:formate dehydrogenase [Pyrus ussuriensis x Pyrus communis]|uniref:Formate dehydrogenase, mitochondrial n=1 Tax=Pyrus ussuriensis x Pyrus communis TaxID=2448454 RepID=A0A5N5G4C7_9ROSA|nr:formate dehydrogenase [Pyrus ussuriensis x Pyrus communis]
MASKGVIASAVRALASSGSSASSTTFTRHLHASGGSKKIVGVFYKANEYAELNPNFLGSQERALGIRDWLESQGHKYIVTDDKDGPNSELEKHIEDLHVLITTPFHPAYVTAERIKKAKNLQLLLTAGIGSDHIDLKAAAAAGLTVAEVTGSNVVSVAEDELMRILILVRNFVPGHQQIVTGEWNVAGIAHRAYDLEGKTVGTVGAGRIGRLLLQRLKPFNCNLLYHDRVKIDPELEQQTGAKFEEDLDAMLPKCDVIVVNTPLTEKTSGLFDKERIAKCKKGVLIVNNARGAIMDTQAVVDACSSGHIAGYSGDVWNPQPAPKDHPWRYMPNHAMTPHISGTTIDAQLRYAAGTKDMLDRYFKGEEFPAQNYIVKDGSAHENVEDQTDVGPVVSSKIVMQKARPDGIQVRQMRIAECLVGDETGTIIFTARNDQVDLMTTGATVILRNAKIDMFKGSMRLAVDKWGRVEVTEPASFSVKEDNNLSLVEYELINVNELANPGAGEVVNAV